MVTSTWLPGEWKELLQISIIWRFKMSMSVLAPPRAVGQYKDTVIWYSHGLVSER